MEGEKDVVPSSDYVLQRFITFKNGVPALTAEPVLTRQHVQSFLFLAATQPYEVTDPLDPDFGKYDGMTVAEVLARKQMEGAAKSGNPDLIERIWDRLIGKALSRGENVNVNASYEDFLKGVAARTKDAAAAAAPVDVNIIDETESEDGIFGDLVSPPKP